MARKPKAGKPDDEGEIDAATGKRVLTNVAARQGCIQNGFEKLFKLRREKEELEEKHLKDVKDAIKKLKRDLKADTDIDSKDLDLAFKLYEREHIAKSMEDDDAERIQDNLREIFGALQAGEMVDFISVLQEAA